MASVDDVLPRAGAFRASRVSVSPIMSELIARKDWSATPLGAPSEWPLELQTMLDVALASRFPMVFWWGPELIQFYNDPYLPIMGNKHPAALGQRAEDCWREIWDVIGPQISGVHEGGPATWNEDVLLDINRNGFVGELYFTWSYSPIPDPMAAERHRRRAVHGSGDDREGHRRTPRVAAARLGSARHRGQKR